MENYPIASPQTLLALSISGESPFGLVLGNQTMLYVDSIVRRVPNKRLVCRATWNQQAVYAKLFVGQGAKRYAQRDQRGATYLRDAGIASPPILYECVVNEVYVLIFEAITQAQNIETVWQSSPQSTRLHIAHLLVRTLAEHHRANLLQTDLYLKNFLLEADCVYTIDGDGVRQFSPLTRAQATRNFAVLVSKFDVVDAHNWLADLIDSYHAVYAEMRLDSNEIKQIALSHLTQVANAYATRKVFRPCTDVHVTQSQSYFSAISAEFAHLNLPIDAAVYDSWISSANLLKNGHTCTVVSMVLEQAKIVIKRYNIKNNSHAIGRMFRKSRAAVSWSNAYRLKLLGIATPKPIALLEQRKLGWFRTKAYFVSELMDAPDVKSYFAMTSSKEARDEAVKQIVLLFYRLNLLQISHGDMKASNIKMLSAMPALIDLDSMRQHNYSYFAQKAHVRDLKRFMQNWHNDNALYNAFVKTFKLVYPDGAILARARILESKEI